MIRLRHPLFALLLGLLVASTQLGGMLHALSHAGGALADSKHHSLSTANTDVCATCASYAGGANVLSGDASAPSAPRPGNDVSTVAPSTVAAAAPSYYRSRAPPTLL
jgi:hypothetical protein